MKNIHENESAGEVSISQDTVDRLMKARNMEEYLAIAAENGIDWNELDDEWLDAIVSGDINDLLWRQQRRLRKSGRRQHENGL